MFKSRLYRLLCLLVIGVPAISHAATTACRLPDFPQEVQCGQIERPLNPAEPDGKKIVIHYAVVPSQDRNKLEDAVFLLAGGPGQSAMNVAGFGQAVLSRLNRRRDLVFVDQRGTGLSAPLHCPDLEEGVEEPDRQAMLEMAQACMKNLQKLPYGELQFFSTAIAVQDLEAVRLKQGYGAINLVGISYGTRVGLEYLRQFPRSVRRMVLDGVTPPDMRLPGADAQSALNGVFAACAREPACKVSYPGLAARWNKLLARLPTQVTVLHPRLANSLTESMTRESLLGLVSKALYRPVSAAALPYAITQAEQGQFAPLLTLSGAMDLPGPGGISFGMHFSVWCGEAYARAGNIVPKDDFEATTAGMYNKVCEKWPRAVIPASFFTVPVSQVPVLLFSGGIDPVTPTRHGSAVSTALGENARHLVVRNAGHGLLAHGCVRDVVYRYLNAKEDADAIKVDASCVRQIPRPLAWQAPVTQPVAGQKISAQNEMKP